MEDNPDTDITIDLDHPQDITNSQQDMPGGFDKPLINISISSIINFFKRRKSNDYRSSNSCGNSKYDSGNT